MFEKLVESGIRKQRGRTGKYLLGTTLIYCCGLLAVAIATVAWFNPGLVEAVELSARLAPPMPHVGPQAVSITPRSFATGVPEAGFVVPRPEPAANSAVNLPNVPRGATTDVRPWIDGEGRYSGRGIPGGAEWGSGSNRSAPPPPPAATPTPQPIPAPTPTETRRVSERVLQGSAIQRVTPLYPAMAKQIRLQGAVRILVTISEEGRVIEATVLDGHPMLRGVSLDAARRWVFTPTRLGSVPVKVQGVLTFNFVMN